MSPLDTSGTVGIIVEVQDSDNEGRLNVQGDDDVDSHGDCLLFFGKMAIKVPAKYIPQIKALNLSLSDNCTVLNGWPISFVA